MFASGVMRARAVRKLWRCVTLIASRARGLGGMFTVDAANTGSVDVTATWCATRFWMSPCTSGPVISNLAHADPVEAAGHWSGFLSARNSVSVNTGPCSKSSMPAAMASGHVTEHR